MLIGERLRTLREARNLSQGDIEKRSGILRFYISRVENGHTVPAIETLEKLARALEIPLYQLFYEEEPPKLSKVRKRLTNKRITSGMSKKDLRFWQRLCLFLARMKKADRRLLLYTAQKMAKR